MRDTRLSRRGLLVGVATLPALPEAAPVAPLRGTPLEGETIRALAQSAGLHYGPAFESLDHAVIESAAGRAAGGRRGARLHRRRVVGLLPL